MSADFRALCEEMLRKYESLDRAINKVGDWDSTSVGDCLDSFEITATRARASLEAVPAPVVGDPEHTGTDRTLLELFYSACQSEGGTADEVTLRGLRAVLAKYGPTPVWVAVSERPWEREGWCDDDGRCWWGRRADDFCNHDWHYATRAEVEEFCADAMPQVSLPFHALPLPEGAP